jgi:hypothetical protein
MKTSYSTEEPENPMNAIMKMKTTKLLLTATAVLAVAVQTVPAQSSELDQVKAAMQVMQKNMEEMQRKMDQLEREKAASNEGASQRISMAITNMEINGRASEVTQRPALNDQQDAAQRPNDLTLDPKYEGFWPVPNTPALIKFNAKPRVDVTSDSRNSGNPDRFATAQIPVKGQAAYGGSEQFNMNAKGSQLSVDVRAPDMPGNFRFYYNNDFFGSGSGMAYRLKQLYGQFYNFTAGYTYSIFEDPDAWPDTVDFEGPNAVIFARRPVVRYLWPINDKWQMNFGVEQPGAEIDAGSTTNSISAVNRAPDGGANIRWEDSKRGHVQLGVILRDIGARGPVVGNQSVFGWGANLAGSINVFQKDSFQAQLTYGEGIFRYFNDDFVNNDAAFDNNGDLKAIPAFGITGGYTHHWNDVLRSTATYGFVDIENEASQGPDAYHQTHYASVNLVWQLRKRLSIGTELLYGKKETQNGKDGDVWRAQVGMVYSLFN